MADEAAYITLLVASERVASWLHDVQHYAGTARCKNAVLQLAEAVQEREAYAEEARRAGAVPILTRLMANADDDDVLDAVSTIVAACSGPMAAGKQRRLVEYAPGVTVCVQEGALGDGLGARVWLVAHLLARQLARNPSLVEGKHVLELGAGCGVVGITAAKVGAARVVLSDMERPVLHNLSACVAANAPATPTTADDHLQHSTADDHLQHTGKTCSVPEEEGGVEALLFDPEEASSCDDEAGLFGMGEMAQQGHDAWHAGVMEVAYLNWNDALNPTRAAAAARAAASQQHALGASTDDRPDHATPGVHAQGVPTQRTAAPSDKDVQSEGIGPPHVPPTDRFDVVLATDVLYEADMAFGVAAAVKRHLAPHGRAVILNAVRFPELHALLLECLEAEGLCWHAQQVDEFAAQAEEFGILGANTDYEGGFVVLYVEHQDALGWGGSYTLFGKERTCCS